MKKELEIQATIENFVKVQEFAETALIENGCPNDMVVNLNICLEEIYVNIASYAYEGHDDPGTARITLEIEKDPYKVVMTFDDSGMPYNPIAKEDPDITLSAEEREIGGLGIFLVKNLMDDVTYERKDGKNILTLTKRE